MLPISFHGIRFLGKLRLAYAVENRILESFCCNLVVVEHNVVHSDSVRCFGSCSVSDSLVGLAPNLSAVVLPIVVVDGLDTPGSNDFRRSANMVGLVVFLRLDFA